jgi:transcriptional regulator with XRE-family HTH domain
MNKQTALILAALLMISSYSAFAMGQEDEPLNNEDKTYIQVNKGKQEPTEQDFAKYAEKIGVTVEELKAVVNSMVDNSPESMNEAAMKLGITAEELQDIIGPPRQGMGQRSDQNQKMEQRPDLAKVAAALGISEDQLKEALGSDRNQSPETIKLAAKKLGVTETELMEAMGPPPMGQNDQAAGGERNQDTKEKGSPMGQKPDFTEAAATLGVTVEELIEALGPPGNSSPDSLKKAAEALGVTQEELMAVLPKPEMP